MSAMQQGKGVGGGGRYTGVRGMHALAVLGPGRMVVLSRMRGHVRCLTRHLRGRAMLTAGHTAGWAPGMQQPSRATTLCLVCWQKESHRPPTPWPPTCRREARKINSGRPSLPPWEEVQLTEIGVEHEQQPQQAPQEEQLGGERRGKEG